MEEVFSIVFRQQIELMGFDYHDKCSSMGVSGLTVTDDLSFMCGATDRSFMVINQFLSEFI